MASFDTLKMKLTRIKTSNVDRKRKELMKHEDEFRNVMLSSDFTLWERELLFQDLAEIYIDLNYISKLKSFLETIKDNELDNNISFEEYIEIMNHFMEFKRLINNIVGEKGKSKKANGSNLYKKGKKLENAMVSFFRAVQADIIKSNLKTDDMEIDIIINFKSPLVLEFIKTDIAFVECKNWDKKVGTPEVRSLHSKLIEENYNTGFLIAMNGLTGDPKHAAKKLIRSLKNNRCSVFIIPIFGSDLVDFSEEKISWGELITDCYYRVIRGEL